MKKEVPIWEKYALTIREAAVYFHIGEMNIRKIVADNADADFIVRVGNRALIKRAKFEEWLNKAKSIEEAFDKPKITPEPIPSKTVIKVTKAPVRPWIR